MRKILPALFLVATVVLLAVTAVRANDIDDLEKQIQEFKKLHSQIDSANKTNKETLNRLNSQLAGIRRQLANLEGEIKTKEKEVKEGENALDFQKKLLAERAKNYYKNSGRNPFSLLNLLVAENFSRSLEEFFLQRSVIDQDRQTILKIVKYIKDLEEKKNSLKAEQIKLAGLKTEVDKQSSFMAAEVEKANKYLSELQSKIATLTAQQQALIASRQSGLNMPKSAYTGQGGCSSDLTNGKNPGFSPAFGFFSFGVPHRVGMNQYGAKGRAESGKSAKEILEFYYNAEYKEGYDTGINIHVVGSNEYGQSFDTNWNIEEYLKHVYEVPTNWSMEALKAQAIAARSYALAYTNNGSRDICPNQGCQVVKQEENSDSWKSAVEQTKGVVLLNGGSPISAYFSSTAGGYTHDSSSDIGSRPWTKNTQDGRSGYGSFDDIKNNAYDKDSPWLYCDWGSRPQYDGTAWLRAEEVADIANVILLVRMDSSTSSHMGQTDKPTGDTWNENKVKDELRSRGRTPFNRIDSISMDVDFGYGKVNGITVNGDAGSERFDGKEFKDFFNVRAPANIQIVGPLYNVERK